VSLIRVYQSIKLAVDYDALKFYLSASYSRASMPVLLHIKTMVFMTKPIGLDNSSHQTDCC
jgi:hypothetical protein